MNYYEILEVSKSATEKEIKDSYKNLVKKYHPDLYEGDKDFAEKMIKMINEAHDVLSDPEKRKEYDFSLNPIQQENYTKDDYSKKIFTNTIYQSTNYQNNSSTTEPNDNLFTKFFMNKLNTLNKQQQLKIFIIILITVLAIFLINLISTKQYLETGQSFLGNPYKHTSDEEDYYEEDDFWEDDEEYDDEEYYDEDEEWEDYESNTIYIDDDDIESFYDALYDYKQKIIDALTVEEPNQN